MPSAIPSEMLQVLSSEQYGQELKAQCKPLCDHDLFYIGRCQKEALRRRCSYFDLKSSAIVAHEHDLYDHLALLGWKTDYFYDLSNNKNYRVTKIYEKQDT